MTKTRLDGYLSRLAQQIDKTALVLVVADEGEEEWVLRRNGQEDLGLGDNFGLANQGVRAWINAEKNKH